MATHARLRLALVFACASALILAVPGAAQETLPVIDEENLCVSADDDTALAVCDESEPALGTASFSAAVADDGLPVVCGDPVEAIFWTGENWQVLGQALADNPNPCATYNISIPPLAGNRMALRQPSVFTALRNLGPQFFPMAEMTMHTNTGWVAWIKANPSRTWYGAGVEFRRRMAVAGASTWFVNEMDGETRLNNGDKTRANMLELLRGLYDGPPGAQPLQGAIEIGIAGRHQDLSDVSPTYKEELKAWLADGEFWAEADPYVRWLAVEAYPDTRHHGVPGSSRGERRRHMGDYIFHVLELAEAGPESVAEARAFFARAYLPLASAGWSYSRGFGNTLVSGEQMAHFISEELHAIRHHSNSHPQGAPAGRFGLAWDPQRLNPDGTPIMDPATFAAGATLLRARIAEAIRWTYRQGGASQMGACHVPGTEARWCEMEREGAEFLDYWSSFESWE